MSVGAAGALGVCMWCPQVLFVPLHGAFGVPCTIVALVAPNSYLISTALHYYIIAVI